MNFGMITLNQNIETEQNYITWILTALLAIHIKTEDFVKILLMMLKNSLSYLTMMNMIKDHFQQVRAIDLLKDELAGEIMKEFVAFRAKTGY